MAEYTKGGKGGSLKIALDNYPYAEDGLLIWEAIHSFARDYLSLFYDDKKQGHRVRVEFD